jgi:hypothetical protein
MFTLFFTNRKSLIAEYLPEGQKYNQDDFISDILPEREREKMRDKRRKQSRTFVVHLDRSKSHHSRKIQGKFDVKDLGRTPHPPYSLDLSPCDFRFFGMTKGKMKDRKFHAVQDIRPRLTENRNDLTFEDVQSVFFERKIRIIWVIENSGEYSSE